MVERLIRRAVLPEAQLPDTAELVSEGRKAAATHRLGVSAFLDHYGVESEAAYKRRCGAEGRVMMHAQIGFRDPAKSQRAYAEIWDRVDKAGYRVDRYGICLDWSMGYPRDMRADMPRGTGLILEDEDDLARMTGAAPASPHYGDFVIGTPAGFENTCLALASGSTSIGNLGQFFTFRQPHWDDDAQVTAETVKAIALTAAQPVEILVHSNMDDGFAALFSDLACSCGAVLIEKYIVEELLGGLVGHCFGNTFSKPYKRLAFQRAIAQVTDTPGTMVYGATTMYGPNHAENYAALANYIRIDALAQKTRPTGHALNPVPVTEAKRIPDIEEVIDVHLMANRLIELENPFDAMFDFTEMDEVAARIVEGGYRFKQNVLDGFDEAGIDTGDAFEMFLAIRRIGSKRLEEMFGPGRPDPNRLRGRRAIERSTSIEEMEDSGEGYVGALDPEVREVIAASGLKPCLATTDVHEYAKVLVETVLRKLELPIADGGVSTDPNDLALRAKKTGADFIALSSYNGIALGFIQDLKVEMAKLGLDVPVFIGGRLNRVPDDSNSSLPIDVSADIREAGAVVCENLDDMLVRLEAMARERVGPVTGAEDAA